MSSGLPIPVLGKHVKAHVTKADQYEAKRDEHILAAGMYLEEAFVRLKDTKEMPWKRFVAVYCDLSERRVRDIRAIARGDKTAEEHREKQRAADTRHQLKKAASVDAAKDAEISVPWRASKVEAKRAAARSIVEQMSEDQLDKFLEEYSHG